MRHFKAIMIAAAFSVGPILYAQSAAPTSFDVSTVKLSAAAPTATSGIQTGHGRLNAQNVTLKRCIIGAYEVGPHQVLGGPDWLDSIRFDITAKIDQPIDDDAVLDVMLQGLLAERFGLQVHRELKVMKAYVLEPAKNGPKLQNADPGESNTTSSSSNTVMTIDADRTSMDLLAKILARRLDLPVVNNTELDGLYKLTLRWTPDSARSANSDAPDYGSIFTAIQEQLGLRLRSTTAPVDSLVIDHAAMPSGN